MELELLNYSCISRKKYQKTDSNQKFITINKNMPDLFIRIGNTITILIVILIYV